MEYLVSMLASNSRRGFEGHIGKFFKIGSRVEPLSWVTGISVYLALEPRHRYFRHRGRESWPVATERGRWTHYELLTITHYVVSGGYWNGRPMKCIMLPQGQISKATGPSH